MGASVIASVVFGLIAVAFLSITVATFLPFRRREIAAAIAERMRAGERGPSAVQFKAPELTPAEKLERLKLCGADASEALALYLFRLQVAQGATGTAQNVQAAALRDLGAAGQRLGAALVRQAAAIEQYQDVGGPS